MKQKAFFIIFKGLPVVKNCLIPECAPLKSVSGTGAFPVHIAKFLRKPTLRNIYERLLLQVSLLTL